LLEEENMEENNRNFKGEGKKLSRGEGGLKKNPQKRRTAKKQRNG